MGGGGTKHHAYPIAARGGYFGFSGKFGLILYIFNQPGSPYPDTLI